MSTMTEPLGPGTVHLEALQRRHQGYAVKFVLDAGPGEEATDANLARVLGSCARPPRADEYPAIRMHVDTCRMAQMSAADAVRDKLHDRAEWYSREARRLIGQGEQGRANLRSAIASELREIAESL